MCLQGNGSQDQNGKDDDHAFTTVLCSARDHFTLKQDMCLSCGSYGVGEEGKLIACVQCGQCYHPYCVNIKVQTCIFCHYLLLHFLFFLAFYCAMLAQSVVMRLHVICLSVRDDQVPCSNRLEFFENNFTAE